MFAEGSVIEEKRSGEIRVLLITWETYKAEIFVADASKSAVIYSLHRNCSKWEVVERLEIQSYIKSEATN